MPITTPAFYVDKLGDPDHFAHVLEYLFTPVLLGAGLEVIPPTVAGSEMIHADIIRNLEQADFVLCDLSSLNPNVLFELGIRTSLDRPVILVKDNLTEKIPFDINGINVPTYDSSIRLWSVAADKPKLTKHVQSTVRGENTGNAMWRYFGLTKRGAPSQAGDNPVEAKLDLLLREMEKSRSVYFSDTVNSLQPPTREDVWTLAGAILQGYGANYWINPPSSDGITRILVQRDHFERLPATVIEALNIALSRFGPDLIVMELTDAGTMTGPVIRDNRRIDPVTGQPRRGSHSARGT
jgi:hypothetical protein